MFTCIYDILSYIKKEQTILPRKIIESLISKHLMRAHLPTDTGSCWGMLFLAVFCNLCFEARYEISTGFYKWTKAGFQVMLHQAFGISQHFRE